MVRALPGFVTVLAILAGASPLTAQTLAAVSGSALRDRCVEAEGPPPSAVSDMLRTAAPLSGKRRPVLNRAIRVNDDLARFSRAF